MKIWPVLGIALLQSFLFSAHWLIGYTLLTFLPMSHSVSLGLWVALGCLSVSFIVATLLGFHHSNFLIASLYKIAAIWFGCLNFLFWAACLCWACDLIRILLHASPAVREPIGAVTFGLALAIIVAGFINARIIRERRVTVSLPNLPDAWRGRKALLLTDLHLGNVNGVGFARRIVSIARRLNPDIVFIAGDLFDGSKVDNQRLAGPLFYLNPPLGTFFAEGNHEDFGDASAYSAAIREGGIRVLHNQRVIIDGVHIIGVPYVDTTLPMRLRTFLDGLELDPATPSILLNHVPNRLPIVEEASVSLQLSGHTHGGQIFPFTWITRRIFGRFTHGLQRYGNLQVLISSGAGTWGPPMRVGTAPEVVLITFQ